MEIRVVNGTKQRILIARLILASGIAGSNDQAGFLRNLDRRVQRVNLDTETPWRNSRTGENAAPSSKY
jgi:hypothetical protein